MNVLVVDGTVLPTPDSMTFKEADQHVNAYRDDTGHLHKTTVRFQTRTMKCSWSSLKQEQLELLRKYAKGKEEFSVTYYEGGYKQMTAYTGDLDYESSRIYRGKTRYKGVTLDFIEI